MGLFSRTKNVTSIEAAAPGTMLIHGERGSKAVNFVGTTDEYYHEETAADYLCQRRYTSVEIKDSAGKIYRYDREAMVRLGWTRAQGKETHRDHIPTQAAPRVHTHRRIPAPRVVLSLRPYLCQWLSKDRSSASTDLARQWRTRRVLLRPVRQDA